MHFFLIPNSGLRRFLPRRRQLPILAIIIYVLLSLYHSFDGCFSAIFAYVGLSIPE